MSTTALLPHGSALALQSRPDVPPASSPLVVPGNAGPFAYVMPRGGRVKLEVVKRNGRWPLAYRCAHNGKVITNPTFVIQRGERVRVELQNRLSESTITHWHGLSVDARNDGAGMLLVEPGKSFAYDFEVRDRGGLYWYHPHPHGRTAAQVYRGLFGMFIVEDDDEIALRGAMALTPGETEIPLVLQDHRLEAVYDPTPMDAIHGYLGTRVFVNGGERPHLDVATRAYRLRILNGSNARNYRLAFQTRSGNTVPFTLIGTDGGLLAAPSVCQEVFLATAERVDVIVDLSDAAVGDVVSMVTRAFDPMHNEMTMTHHEEFPEGGSRDLLELRVKRRERYAAKVPATLSAPPAIDVADARERPLRLGFAKGSWRINDMVFAMGETPIEVKRNSVETWLIRNYFNSMPHAMHLHGFHFDVLQRETSPDQIAALKVDDRGRLATDLGSRDTVLVWPGESVRIAIDFALPQTPSYAGDQTYLFHCHNLEHEDAGMMLGVKVS